jgi:outer membrane protein TolC
VAKERNLRTAQRELALLLGHGASEAVRAEGPLNLPLPNGDLATLQRSALERRPDLGVARAAVSAADADLKLL